MTTRYQLTTSALYINIENNGLAWRIEDRPRTTKLQTSVLENYFNDVYHYFLNKLTAFTQSAQTSTHEEEKLKALLSEIVKVKCLLQGKDDQCYPNYKQDKPVSRNGLS